MPHEAFYSTAATVIPVLFLALTLQSPEMTQARPESRDDDSSRVKVRWNLVMLAIVLGVGGELLAVTALVTTYDYVVVRWLVAVATFVLTLGVGYAFYRLVSGGQIRPPLKVRLTKPEEE
jgi:hypothetical protein